MDKAIISFAVACVVSAGSTAVGQVALVGGFDSPYRHHASTYEEGVLRGWADVTRSVGVKNYYNSLAAINLEEAKSKYLDNEVKRVDTYFTVRELNREGRAAERGPRPTQQQLARFAEQRSPGRLSDRQQDALTGRVYWPATLDTEQYASDRAEVDRLMAERTLGEAGLGTDNYREIDQTVENMKETLKSQLGTIAPAEYVTAKKFLSSLQYEAQFAPGTSGLAAR